MIPIFKSLIEVINVDPFAESIGPELLLSEGINPEDLNIVRGTIEEVQERFRGQIDLVYSYEVLPNTAGAIELMEACASLLAPDGEALLMDENHRQYGDAFLSFFLSFF